MRVPKITTVKLQAYLNSGLTILDIAAREGVSKQTVKRAIQRIEAPAKPVECEPLPEGLTVDETEQRWLESHVSELLATVARMRQRMDEATRTSDAGPAKNWAVCIGIVQDKVTLSMERLRKLRPVEEVHEVADFDTFPEPEPPPGVTVTTH